MVVDVGVNFCGFFLQMRSKGVDYQFYLSVYYNFKFIFIYLILFQGEDQ